MAGLGLFPVGSTPFGAGTPVEATAPPTAIPELANFLDPRTGDYVVQADGSYQRMPVVRHRVLMLVKTELGSAAPEPDIGLRLPQKMDQSFEQRARQAVTRALAPISSEDMHIDGIPVERSGMGRADITIEFTDLTTGESDALVL